MSRSRLFNVYIEAVYYKLKSQSRVGPVFVVFHLNPYNKHVAILLCKTLNL